MGSTSPSFFPVFRARMRSVVYKHDGIWTTRRRAAGATTAPRREMGETPHPTPVPPPPRTDAPPPPPGGNGGARGACPGGETTGGRERQHLQEDFRCFVELVLLPLIGVHLRCMQDPTDCNCGEGRLLHPPHTTYIIPYIIALAAAPSVFPRWHFEKFDGSQDIFLHPQNVQFRKPIPSWKKPVQAR